MTPVEQITSLYVGYFGRAPEPAGLNYWVGRLADGFSLAEIAESFSVQAESTTKYPFLANPNVASPEAFITQVYLNLFNRVPDAAGLAYWSAELANGADIGDFILNVISGAQGDDKVIIDNKIEVGADFALEAANLPGFVYDADAANAAVEVINGVDETQASVDAGKAETDAFVAGVDSNPGETIALTNVVSSTVGTSGNDTITGVVENNFISTGTFQTGDSINGGAGDNDVLSLIVSSVGAPITPANISNVETIRFQDLVGANVNMTNVSGVNTVESTNSAAVTTLTNVGSLVDVAISGQGAGGFNIGYNAAVVAGTADVQDVSVTEAANAIVNAAGTEIVNVVSTGTNNLNIVSAVETVNVSGAGDTVFAAFGGSLETFNAAAATGSVDADFTGVTDLTATGGAGDDTFNFNDTLDENDTVDGGAGSDTVELDTTAGTFNFSAATDAAGINGITNVERLSFYGANGVTINGATFQNSAVTNLQFATDGADVINNAGSARTYEFADLNGTNSNGSATFNMNGTSTALNISLLGTDGSALVADDGDSVDVDALTINLSGVQPAGTTSTVNIVSAGDFADGDYNDIDTVTAASGSTFNISGSGNLQLGDFANRAIINASALTGDLEVEGSQASAAIVLDGAPTGADVITLGSGNDLVTFSSALDSGAGNGASGAVAGSLFVDIVNGFTAGANGDVLDITFAGADSDYTAIAAADQDAINLLSGNVGPNAATLQNAANIAANLATVDEWTAFTFQGQTYAQYDADGNGDYNAGTDLLVQITGVTVANLTDANFA